MKERGEKPALWTELLGEPYRFEFLAAVRLLEALAPERRGLAEGDNPNLEGIRFRSPPRLDFPAGELESIEKPADGEPFVVEANFFGLAQVNGPLPYSFAEELIDRAFHRDHAGGDFLDVFHHRLLSILFRARKKYRPALTHEAPDRGRVGLTLKALVGLGTRGLEDRLKVPDRSLMELSGLLLGTRRTQVGLEQAIFHHFAMKAEIVPFRGSFKPLGKYQLTRLGRQNSVLRGPCDPALDGAVLGDRAFIADAGFELRLGPIDDAALEILLPGGERFEALVDLLHFYTDHRYDLAIRPLVAAGSPRRCRLTRHGAAPGEVSPAGDGRPARLGWNSWLLTRPTAKVDQQVVLRPDGARSGPPRHHQAGSRENVEAPQPFRLDLGSALDDV